MKSVTALINSNLVENQLFLVLKLVMAQTVHIYADVQSNNLLSLLFFCVHIFVSRNITSCRQAAGTIWPRPSSLCRCRSTSRRRADRHACRRQRSRLYSQYVLTLTAADALTPWWVKRPGDLDLWSFDHESGDRVTFAIAAPISVFVGPT